jgi:hypothetical protein
MTLTLHRRAKVDTQHRLWLRYAAFPIGGMVDIVAKYVEPTPVLASQPKAYSFFNAIKPIDAAELPADYSLNFEQSLYPDFHTGRAA